MPPWARGLVFGVQRGSGRALGEERAIHRGCILETTIEPVLPPISSKTCSQASVNPQRGALGAFLLVISRSRWLRDLARNRAVGCPVCLRRIKPARRVAGLGGADHVVDPVLQGGDPARADGASSRLDDDPPFRWTASLGGLSGRLHSAFDKLPPDAARYAVWLSASCLFRAWPGSMGRVPAVSLPILLRHGHGSSTSQAAVAVPIRRRRGFTQMGAFDYGTHLGFMARSVQVLYPAAGARWKY